MRPALVCECDSEAALKELAHIAQGEYDLYLESLCFICDRCHRFKKRMLRSCT